MATDAFQQGKLAFQNNVPKSACEYPAGSTLRNEWMEGWTQGLNARPADHSHDAGHEGETRH
ncbi:Rmf/CrpP family protein [Aureimonas sp. Leaf324]|jgi:ribosome modulation factor|uniref:ribosome modulation factor n=1 Tax=Aureimonas TaxID=414371 RepID=UPI0006F8F57D|nr:Rmf/CrpP family protein [Aureimonas sp. Leaf324]KQQ90336.1 hypothetical protein ASF65_15950 [Aureimonas sp. Leaf324]